MMRAGVVGVPGFLDRSLAPVLRRAASEFPAVILTGPRQSGKTTLLHRLFGKQFRYVSLEAPDVRAAAREDPRGFLAAYPPPVILDEVQYAPEVLPYVKERIDAERDRPGQYFLAASQNLLLAEKITESLAGRAAVLRLLPLSQREAEGRPDAPLPWESENRPDVPGIAYRELWTRLLRGSYPELVAHPERDARLWHASYVHTYLERDVRNLRQVGDLSEFQSFLRILAARSGQLLNLSDLARDLGIAVNTAKSWLSILEATDQVVLLRPYFVNVGKRLVKTPKVYFTDVGTLCYLVGLKDPEHAAHGPMAGAILETAVLTEIRKTYLHRGDDPSVFFWRTSGGMEVDFVVETEGRLVPVEVKLSATPRPSMADGIRAFRADYGARVAGGYVVHPGTMRLPLGGNVTALPFAEL